MGDSASSGLTSLRTLEKKYLSDLKSAIRNYREWEARRTETDVVQLVLDQEGDLLKRQISNRLSLAKEARAWRVSQRKEQITA